MNVAEYFVQRLLLEGVTHVFTVPGGTVLPLMEAMSRTPELRVVVCKDEQGAAYMADGYAWSSGKPGVVVTIGGPGATSTLTGLCCAKAQGNPVVLVSGEINGSQVGRRAAQDGSAFGLDVTALSAPATVLSVAAATAAQARTALDEAFRRAVRLRQPAHVSLPLDVQRGEAGSAPPRASRASVSFATASPDGIEQAARVLAKSPPRVAMLIGRGGAGASEELLALAERLGAAVATTCGGKGLFPESHPLSVGVFSFGSGPLARAALTTGIDVLLAIGTGLGEFATMNYSDALVPRTALIHVDLDPTVLGRNYDCLPVSGDAREVCRALLRALPESAPRARPAWLERLRAVTPRVFEPERLLSSQLPLRPERVMSELQRVLPESAQLVADIGTSCLFVAHCVQLTPPQRCYVPMVWSCMGHPLGAALGVRLGSGQPTICVAGDAAFLAKGLELHAAVEQGVTHFVVVVLSNQGHGLVRFGTRALTSATSRTEDGTFRTIPNLAAIARALGAEALRVSAPSELEAALKHGLTCGRPCLIEVIVDPDAVPPMADRLNSLDQVRPATSGEAS